MKSVDDFLFNIGTALVMLVIWGVVPYLTLLAIAALIDYLH